MLKKQTTFAAGSLLAVACAAAIAGVHPSRSESASTRTLDSYYVHRPGGLPLTRKVPLVLGIGGRLLEQISGLNALADKQGFVIAYVTITKSYTDEAARRGPGPPFPDVQYIAGVIDRVSRDENIDPTRVYSTGGSQGGALSYRLACDYPQKVAAIGSVSGGDPVPGCQPAAAVSVMEIHGTNDQFISFPRAQGSIDHWRAVDNCPASASTSVNGRITQWTWAPCRSRTAVSLIKYEGGGHGWYTGAQLDSATTFWSFFAAHPKSTALAASLGPAKVLYTRPRRLRISVTTSEPATATLSLVRAARKLASKRSAVAAGTHALTLAIPRTAHAGRYTLVVSLKTSTDSRTFRKTIRLTR